MDSAALRHLSVVSLLAVAAQIPVHAQTDTALTETLIEVRVARGPQTVALALARSQILYLSLETFGQLAEIDPTSVLPGERWETVLQPEGIVVRIDHASESAEVAGEIRHLALGDVIWREEEPYVAAGLIEYLFDVRMDVNWVELTALIRQADHLPSVRRMERELRRARLLAAQSPVSVDPLAPLTVRAADGAVLDWAVTSGTRDPLHTTGLDLGLGVQVMGGSLEARHAERSTSIGRSTWTRVAWMRAWNDRKWYRQLRLGHGPATGPVPSGLLGFAVTNAPYVRPSDFAQEILLGTVPSGWEVELYQHGQLLGYTTSDRLDAYRLDVPLRYGQNPFEIAAYGPTGQVRRSRLAYVVPFDRLPAGEFEYGVSGGACDRDPCQGQMNLDARYGLLPWLTVRAGLQSYWRDSLADLWQPYAMFAAQPTRSVNIALEGVAGAFGAGRVTVAPSPDLEARLDHTEFARGAQSPILGSAALERRTIASLFWRPGTSDRAPFLRVDASLYDATMGMSLTTRATGTARVGRARVEVGITHHDHGALSAQTTLDFSAGAAFGTVARHFSNAFGRVLVAVDPNFGLDRAMARASFGLSSPVRVEMGGGWDRRFGATVEIGITTAFDALRAMSRNTYRSDGGLDGLQMFEGSVLWDTRSKSVGFADGRSVGRAGLVGAVFLDANANGRRDPGEEGASGVRVRVGAQSELTDSTGAFAAWDLLPYEPLIVAVDTMSLDNPLWVPARLAVRVAVGPNAFERIEIPMVMAGEVSGKVVYSVNERPAPGMPLVIESEEGRAVVRTAAFSDGAFYFFGLRPGSYRLAIPAEHLERLGVIAEPVTFRVDPAAGSTIIDDLVLRVGPDRG